MEEYILLDTVDRYNKWNNHETLHPLVSVVDLSKADARKRTDLHIGVYIITLKDVHCGDLIYGKQTYDYQEGTLVFLAPGQVVGAVKPGELYQPKGYALVFDSDFIRGTSLNQHMHEYTFFSYAVHEALHISQKEREIILQCLEKISHELAHPIDKHSKKLIVSNIELFLNYCSRFYERQFITREHVHQGILDRLERLLHDHFSSEKTQTVGLPSVKYCANELNLSSNYFSDLIRKETGRSAQEYIQGKTIEVAKEKLHDTARSVSEVAYALGFKYPQHFTRLFKQRVGVTPMEYRSSVN